MKYCFLLKLSRKTSNVHWLTCFLIHDDRRMKQLGILPTWKKYQFTVYSRGCQFCTTERPQLFEFEVASCRTCRLRSKKAILEVATSNLQKWRGFAQSWGPCMLIWHPLYQQMLLWNFKAHILETKIRRPIATICIALDGTSLCTQMHVLSKTKIDDRRRGSC